MAYTTVNKSTAHFNTLTYSGNGSNPRTLTGVGFQPDFVWQKNRTDSNGHTLADAVRGANKTLSSDGTGAEVTDKSDGHLDAFTSDGFTVGAGSGGDARVNDGSHTYVAWNWKANGAGSSNSDATGSYPITSTVSANTTAGFSIVKYTGNGYSTATIGHGLGSKPAMVIMRPLGYTGAWWIIHKDLTADHVLEFNTNAQANISSFGGGGLKYSTFTNAVIGGGNGSSNSDLWNKSGEDYIAYCFAEKTGYSKFGSYTGNGNTNGTFVYTGFKPAFVIIKNTAVTEHWAMHDNKRPGYNGNGYYLYPNLSNAEVANNSSHTVDFLSNGFKIRSDNDQWNDVETMIYMCFGQSLVGSNNVPNTAV